MLEDICKKLNLVAEHLLLIFKNTTNGCDQVEAELKEFLTISGLEVDNDKSSVKCLKSGQPLSQDKLPYFSRNQGPIKYIGFEFHTYEKEMWKRNVHSKLEEIFREFHTTPDLVVFALLWNAL